MLLASLFWFRGHAPWELVRTKPLDFVAQWFHAGQAASGLRWTTMVGLFVSAMFKGLTPVFTLFACIGVAVRRRDHQAAWPVPREMQRGAGCQPAMNTADWQSAPRAIFYTVLLFLAAIWIHLSISHETSKRYFLPIVLLMSPWAAWGLLACAAQLVRWAEKRRWDRPARLGASWLPFLIFAAFSLGNVLLSDYRQRAVLAELGHWTQTEFGPMPAVLGPGGVTQVVAYYARGSCELFDPHENDQAIEDLMRHGPCDVVLLPDNRRPDNNSTRCAAGPDGFTPGHADLLRAAAGLGYRPLDDQPLSARLRNMTVLVRRAPAGQLPSPSGRGAGGGLLKTNWGRAVILYPVFVPDRHSGVGLVR